MGPTVVMLACEPAESSPHMVPLADGPLPAAKTLAHAGSRSSFAFPATLESEPTPKLCCAAPLPTPQAQEHALNGSLSATASARSKGPVMIIGVAGGTASGKTTVCDRIYQRLHDDSAVSMLSQDAFYRPLTAAEKVLAERGEFNFDHPGAFDEDAMVETLNALKDRRPVDVPVYCFKSHTRSTVETRRVGPADVVIIEGILVLHMPRIRDLLHMKVFVDTDDDVRLARRIQRDVACRGRDVAGVIEQYTSFVKPMFDTYVAPSRRHADLIVPWSADNNVVAIDLITEHIRSKLGQHVLRRVYPNLEVLPSNYQTRGMHTILRDRSTPKSDFVFYADRLMRLVVEAGLGHLPFSEQVVTTPTGHPYVGVRFCKGVCGVSIIRSGEAMEAALRACCSGIKVGKMLVTRHHDVTEDLIYEKLPADIADRHVILMDAVLSTGNTVCKAVQALLSKGVREERILFCCIIAAPEGVNKVCKAFPAMKVIASEIDDRLDDNCMVVPGCGSFGDRYFCE